MQADRLVRVQRSLLNMGYQYIDGEISNWPLNLVLMQKDEQTVLIGPMIPQTNDRLSVNWNALAGKGKRIGLMLVGTNSIQSPEVRAFFDSTCGTVAYVDVVSGQMRLRRTRPGLLTAVPKLFNQRTLNDLLGGPIGEPGDLAQARQTLMAKLQELQDAQEFTERTSEATSGHGGLMVKTIIGLCVGVFLFRMTSLSGLLYENFDLFGPPIAQGQWWRIITSGLLHANTMHIAFNMLALYYIGRPLEAFQGAPRLLAYFLMAVITGNLVSLWWDPTVHSVGASGGVFGLIGAMGAVILRHRRDFPPAIWQGIKKWLMTILFYNVVFFLIPNINGSAHVGGLIGGFLLALVIATSPTRRQSISMAAMIVLTALLSVTAAFGSYAIKTIPTDFHNYESRKHMLMRNGIEWLMPKGRAAQPAPQSQPAKPKKPKAAPIDPDMIATTIYSTSNGCSNLSPSGGLEYTGSDSRPKEL